MRALAAKCVEGVVPTLKAAHKMDDAELIARLTEVRGIGPWTVHMLLIFYLGRPDVLPTGDFSIRASSSSFTGSEKTPRQRQCYYMRGAGSPTARWRAGICGGHSM